MLNWLIYLPVAGMLAVMLLPKNAKVAIRWTSAVFSGIPMILSGWLTWDYFFNYSGSSFSIIWVWMVYRFRCCS